jgi:hypothetical protein
MLCWLSSRAADDGTDARAHRKPVPERCGSARRGPALQRRPSCACLR